MSSLIGNIERQTNQLRDKTSSKFVLFTAEILFREVESTLEDVTLLFTHYGFKRCYIILNNDCYVQVHNKAQLEEKFKDTIGVAINVFIDDTYIL